MQNFGEPKTVRMEKESVKIVKAMPGRNFSEKLRYIIDTFAAQNPEKVKKAWEPAEMIEGGETVE